MAILVLRPSQLRAAAAESALLIPYAIALGRRYHEITPPVVIMAGAKDRYADLTGMQFVCTMSSSDTDKVFSGSIPKLYETYLVPPIFQPYAADLVNRLVSRSLTRVLEIAAGTGVVTRTLASVLPESVCIVATDLNQPMLNQAAALGTKLPRSEPSVLWSGVRRMPCNCLFETERLTPLYASSESCSSGAALQTLLSP